VPIFILRKDSATEIKLTRLLGGGAIIKVVCENTFR